MSVFSKINYRFLSLTKCIKKGTIVLYLSFLLISLMLLLSFTKRLLHIEMNQYHSNFFDFFFKYVTYFGDGILFGLFIIVFFFVKKKMSLVFAVSGVLTLLLTHLFKKIIFKGIPRPVKLIGEEGLHIVDGVKIAMTNSFPSGHTTTAFAIFTILILYHSKKTIQYLWVLLAILAGLSRVYLSQHFLIDVFVGSFLGVFIGFVSMMIFFPEKTNNEIKL